MLKSLRTRRSAAKALAVGAVVGAGLVTGATPAQAAASNCPQSRICLYDGANFTGLRFVGRCRGFREPTSLWQTSVNVRLAQAFRPHLQPGKRAYVPGVSSMHNRCADNVRITGRRATRIVKTGQRIGNLGYSHLSNDPYLRLGNHSALPR